MKRFPWLILVLALTVPLTAVAQQPQDEAEEENGPRLAAKTFAGLELRSIGPAFMSGRIADIAIRPRRSLEHLVRRRRQRQRLEDRECRHHLEAEYLRRSGLVFDRAADARSQASPNTVWVGTGENVGGRHVGYGDGVYRASTAAALDATWAGDLRAHRQDPRRPERLEGRLRRRARARCGRAAASAVCSRPPTAVVRPGKKVLGDGEYTGVNDVVMDPARPRRALRATGINALRTVAALIDGGPETGIHKSTDGGATWRSSRGASPKEDMGKIGLAISPQNPDVVYATIELGHGARAASTARRRRRATWEKRSDYVSGGTGPHYYQEIYASPHALRPHLSDGCPHPRVSDDGGKNFTHAGRRAQAQRQPRHRLRPGRSRLPAGRQRRRSVRDLGPRRRGNSWPTCRSPSSTRWRSTTTSPSTTSTAAPRTTAPRAGRRAPTTSTASATATGSSPLLATATSRRSIPPTPTSSIPSGSRGTCIARTTGRPARSSTSSRSPRKGAPAERFNWDSPILISPHDPARLYFASQRVWRSDDRGDSWRRSAATSRTQPGALTIADDGPGPAVGGTRSGISWAMSTYNTVTSLAESPLQEGLIYAGTDDGLIQVSPRTAAPTGGKIDRVGSLPGVPEHGFVNDIKADLFDSDTVVRRLFDNRQDRAISNPIVAQEHRQGVRTWSFYCGRSAGSAPGVAHRAGPRAARTVVRRYRVRHLFHRRRRQQVGSSSPAGYPNIPFRDLAIQKRENDLVGATFGRSFYVFDDYTPLRQVSEEMLEQQVELFPVRDAWVVHPPVAFWRCRAGGPGCGLFQSPPTPRLARFSPTT